METVAHVVTGETHSASRLSDFQTRRLNLRYRDAEGTIRYPYALNNTVAASPGVDSILKCT